jgi:two-component sensor histidine kinase/PAS domain-containing protein
VASLSELVRAHADLDEPALGQLHLLVAEWQLISDLSFADLLLFVRTRVTVEPTYLCVAQMRPTTGPTMYVDDLVGATVTASDRFAVDRAWREGRIVRDGEPEWRNDVPVREEGIPVRHRDQVVAVLARDTNLATSRTPSPLELAYLAAASDLIQMVAEGRFPFPGAETHLAGGPRVGDGLLRLDDDGVIVFSSPNASSALRRLGWTANLTGASYADVVAGMQLSGEVAEARVDDVLETRRPTEAEVVDSDGEVVVRLRAVPLLPGGTLLGALVLVRDVTEVRRRDRQLVTKDATIREIHHRVKNNLQTVAALLRLQARRTTVGEARSALEESVRRVTSIAVVHETLSQALDESVDFDGIADTIASVAVDLATTRTSARVATTREGSFGVLPAQVATPMALVLSELLANAVEHAYGGDSGKLHVRVRRSAASLEMVVADQGPGLPEGFSLERASGLGLQIVRTLVVGELRGTFGLRPGAAGGTEAVVAVPGSML